MPTGNKTQELHKLEKNQTKTKPPKAPQKTTDTRFPSDLAKDDPEHFKSSASFQFI